MLIFVGGLSPSVDKTSSNVIYFGPGVHDITSNGPSSILYTSKSTIYFARGSWVRGKIKINGGSGTVKIQGYGVLDGSYFDYSKRNNKNTVHAAYSIVSDNRAVNLLGLTVFNPSNLAIGALSANSVVRGYKMLGWYYNNDGIGLAANSQITDSFIRTNDDSVKLSYAGSSSITIKRVVVWQSFNGGVFQFGWNGNGCTNCLISDCDVIHAEWEGWNAQTSGQNNNAVINMNQAQNGHYKDITIDNIRIDTNVGRIIGLRFNNVNNNGYINGLTISNFNIRTVLKWFNPSNTVENFIQILNSPGSYIKNVYFENIKINGKKVTSNTQSGWNLKKSGAVTNVKYS